LCSLSTAEKPKSKIICLPGQDKGSLKVLNYVADKSIDLVIPAHDTEVGAMAVNPDGTLIASASARGHIIKIYSSDGGEVV
jgi:WD40 repeat protein